MEVKMTAISPLTKEAESTEGVFGPLSSETSPHELTGEGFSGSPELSLMKNIHKHREQLHCYPSCLLQPHV